VDEHVKHGWPRHIMRVISFCFFYLLKVFLWCAFTVLHLMIMIDIYRNPNFTPAVSLGIIVFVSSIDLYVFINAYLRKGIFPVVDTRLTDVFRVKHPDSYQTFLTKAEDEHRSKWWIVRVFTRPNPGKMLGRVPVIPGQTWKERLRLWATFNVSK
jgi:hypothetical protein